MCHSARVLCVASALFASLTIAIVASASGCDRSRHEPLGFRGGGRRARGAGL